MRLRLSAVFFSTAFLLLGHALNAGVFNVADGDIIGLKNAINAVNTNAEDDTIQLATGGNYTLTAVDNGVNGLPQLGADSGHKLTITGNGATVRRSTVGGTPNIRLFYVSSSANVTLTGLTIAGGGSGMNGAAVYVNGHGGSTTLNVMNVTFSGNYGYYGGAIYNDGNAGSAHLNITNCTFFQNLSENNGGAIYNDGSFGGSATYVVTGSTFQLNFTEANGGGAIQNYSGEGSVNGNISNSTFHANYAPGSGAAIYADNATVLVILNCTFNQNTSDSFGVLANFGSPSFQIGNSVFKGDGFTQNLAGSITSLGHNICDDDGSGFLTGPGDRINTNPMVDPAGLQNNGGPTNTIALLPGSPAINAGNDANAPARDQRSYRRLDTSDAGAMEYSGTLAPMSAASSKSHGAAGTFLVDMPLTGTAGIECRIGGGVHQLVMPFASSVTATGASVSSGVGSVSNFSVSGSQLIVNLTGVTNAQQINVRITNVSDGIHTNNVDVPMRFLLGDTTGNSTVNASDVTLIKQQLGQLVSSSNFRRDVNVNGTINASDVTVTKAQLGMAIP